MKIPFELNGEDVEMEVSPVTLLRDALREEFGCTDVKKGCISGRCGVCTVLLDGAAVKSCLILAPKVINRSVTTVTGLEKRDNADNQQLHPVQEAFANGFAAQCGYCTPGFVLSAVDYLENQATPTDGRTEIRAALKGNVCRCTGYVKIIDAVQAVIDSEIHD